VATVLNEPAIETFAEAIFTEPNALVLEAYFEFDKEPRQFHSTAELVDFVHSCFVRRGGYAHFFVVYPEMRGHPIRKTIYLDQSKVQDGKLRYTWEGWGLISVILQKEEKLNQKSTVSSNSETRAKAWASTHPEWPSPDSWNWKAITKHTRRLQRVLKKAVT